MKQDQASTTLFEKSKTNSLFVHDENIAKQIEEEQKEGAVNNNSQNIFKLPSRDGKRPDQKDLEISPKKYLEYVKSKGLNFS